VIVDPIGCPEPTRQSRRDPGPSSLVNTFTSLHDVGLSHHLPLVPARFINAQPTGSEFEDRNYHVPVAIPTLRNRPQTIEKTVDPGERVCLQAMSPNWRFVVAQSTATGKTNYLLPEEFHHAAAEGFLCFTLPATKPPWPQNRPSLVTSAGSHPK